MRKLRQGYMPGQFMWTPAGVVIKVDRRNVSREWTKLKATGSTPKDQAFPVESKDSINFSIGANINCYIDEKDAALFRARNGDLTLEQVLDSTGHGLLATHFSKGFGGLMLEECYAQKLEIFEVIRPLITQEFAERGITIASFGLAEGLIFENPEIQTAINAKFVAEQDRQTQEARNKLISLRLKNEVEIASQITGHEEQLLVKAQIDALSAWSEGVRRGAPVQIIATLGGGSQPLIPGVLFPQSSIPAAVTTTKEQAAVPKGTAP